MQKTNTKLRKISALYLFFALFLGGSIMYKASLWNCHDAYKSNCKALLCTCTCKGNYKDNCLQIEDLRALSAQRTALYPIDQPKG